MNSVRLISSETRLALDCIWVVTVVVEIVVIARVEGGAGIRVRTTAC